MLSANWLGLTSLFGLNGWASYLVTLKGLVGFENNFNGRYFHHNFCVKTGVRFFCVLSGTRDLQWTAFAISKIVQGSFKTSLSCNTK